MSRAFVSALDPSEASPGFLGFLVVFGIALALWFLIKNMTARLRRMDYAEKAARQRGAQEAARRADDDPSSPGEAPDDGRDSVQGE